jgi:hypothetical protein
VSRLRGVGGSLLSLLFTGGRAEYGSSGAAVDGVSFQKNIEEKLIYSVGCGKRGR